MKDFILCWQDNTDKLENLFVIKQITPASLNIP